MCDSCSSSVHFSGVFDDFGDYEDSLVGWRLEASHLEPIALSIDSLRIANQSGSFARSSFSAITSGRLTSYKDGISFFFPEKSEHSMVLNGRPCASEVICSLPCGEAIEAIVPRDFVVYTFSMGASWLCSQGYGWLLDALQQEPLTLPLASHEAEILRKVLRLAASYLEQGGDPQELSCNVNRSCETDFLPLLAKVLSKKLPLLPSDASRQDYEHLNLLLEYIAEHLDSSLTVDQLAECRGVTSRYVQQLFQRYVGISPKKYLRSARLNEVRRCLTRMEPQRGAVTDVASRYGFDHLGQFSRDYKKLFGELPKETLAR